MRKAVKFFLLMIIILFINTIQLFARVSLKNGTLTLEEADCEVFIK